MLEGGLVQIHDDFFHFIMKFGIIPPSIRIGSERALLQCSTYILGFYLKFLVFTRQNVLQESFGKLWLIGGRNHEYTLVLKTFQCLLKLFLRKVRRSSHFFENRASFLQISEQNRRWIPRALTPSVGRCTARLFFL